MIIFFVFQRQFVRGIVLSGIKGWRVGEITRGRKADAVFEVTGNPTVIPSLPPLLRRRGRLILLGSPRGPSTIDFHDEVHTFGLKVIGAYGSNHPPVETPIDVWTWQRSAELFLDLLRAGRVDVRDLVTHRFAWRQGPEVFETLLQDRTGFRGVILDWEAARARVLPRRDYPTGVGGAEMYVSRLTFATQPGHTGEVEEKLKRLADLVARAGGQRPRVLRAHFASLGAPDLVFEQEVPDLAELEREIGDVTHQQEFQRLAGEISGRLVHSSKREIYQIVD